VWHAVARGTCHRHCHCASNMDVRINTNAHYTLARHTIHVKQLEFGRHNDIVVGLSRLLHTRHGSHVLQGCASGRKGVKARNISGVPKQHPNTQQQTGRQADERDRNTHSSEKKSQSATPCTKWYWHQRPHPLVLVAEANQNSSRQCCGKRRGAYSIAPR